MNPQNHWQQVYQTKAADAVSWWVADITQAALPAARYDVWHDRAVFHFLTDDAQRNCIRRRLARRSSFFVATASSRSETTSVIFTTVKSAILESGRLNSG